MRMAKLALCFLLLSAPPAAAMTWQEANKASVAKMNEGNLKEAFDLAWTAAELYEQSPTYKATSHERLLLNAVDIFLQTERPRETPSMVRKSIAALGRHVSDDDATMVSLYTQLAAAFQRIGDFPAARDARDRVIALNAKNYGEDSLGLVQALLDQARYLKQIQDIVVTRKYLNRASEIVAKLEPGNAVRLMVDYEQALLTLETERYGDAEPLFLSLAERAEPNRSVNAIGSILRPTYGMLAFIAHKRGDQVREDQMVEATRGLPVEAGVANPLFQELPRIPGGSELALAGYALIEYKVSTADGKVKEIRILEKSGNPQYASLASDAVREWRFQPSAPVGDEGELITHKQPFRYQYQNDKPELGTRLKRSN
ncbi:TonB family protein [Niveispirillum sp.]|uniref:TonB family protein n=1 Tax=Niveispirillum sp. TaxID=1917217 RepID=UPI001B4C5D25|nr:TonB family protein [Niveispirillum sp.]MBP7336069.1 TonB family protein [Niveispirillum sp.]